MDTNDELATVDIFAYLRHLLKEPAKSVVAGFKLMESNYESAKTLLRQRFANQLLSSGRIFTN